MIEPRRVIASFVLAAVLVVASALVPRPAMAVMTENQVRAKITAEFGVRVLKVRRSRYDGRAVFLVTVMNPGGDFNEAFQITTLAVDVGTGKLVSGFRHSSSGLRGNQSPPYRTNR